MIGYDFRERIAIEGIMPERALLKLRRAGIAVYNVKKPQKSRILFSVKKKDIEKVFAIYPKVCYNNSVYSPYTATHLGAEGVGRWIEFAKKRSCFLLGATLFCAVTLFSDSLVFGVEFVGSSVYKREACELLETHGIKPFSRYDNREIDSVCSKLLTLDGVEFCSIKKSGARVLVEMRLDATPQKPFEKGDLVARHTGEILSITALRGTPLKKKGDGVRIGETLVGGWFSSIEGEQVRVEPIARASIACVYEAQIEAEDEECAFASAYLALDLSDFDEISKREITPKDGGYFVRIEYTAIEKINF